MDSIFVVMPAYNEQENIETVVKQWYSVLEGKSSDSRLVVADSESTDNTHEILKKLKRSYPRLEILQHTQKQHGPKILALYRYAIKNRADYIFQTDSDGQTDPKEFEQFWDLRKRYDIVVGKRTVRGDGKDRAFVEHVVCFLLKIFFGVDVPDANAPFRLMKSSVVQKYLDKLPQDYNIPNIMLTTYFAYYKEKMVFKEISFRSRKSGKNSINICKIIQIGWRAIGDFKKLRREL